MFLTHCGVSCGYYTLSLNSSSSKKENRILGFPSMAMAMQMGIGLSKVLILVGAGYSGSIVLGKRQLSDILAELQALVKGMEKSGDSNTDSDAVAQVRRLTMEVQQIAASLQITVLNGNSSQIALLLMHLSVMQLIGKKFAWEILWACLSLLFQLDLKVLRTHLQVVLDEDPPSLPAYMLHLNMTVL